VGKKLGSAAEAETPRKNGASSLERNKGKEGGGRKNQKRQRGKPLRQQINSEVYQPRTKHYW